MKTNNVQRIALSAAVSLLALGLVFGLVSKTHAGVSPAVLLKALRGAVAAFVALYVVTQLCQAGLRATRARLLIRHGSDDGHVPGGWHMFWVTIARNMFVDMLPARLGELSYVAMLNRGYNIGADVCLSSLSIGLVFDFLALLVVLAVAIPAAAQGASLVGSLIMLAAVCVVGYTGLFHILPWGVRWVRRSWPRGLVTWKPFAAVLTLAESTADSVVRVRRGGILAAVLGLSAGIRVFKYTGMYFLFLAVTRPLWPELAAASPWAVLVALIAAEGASSLPVPTFMSFGTYEAGGLAALRALGFAAGDSIMAMFALHVMSQCVDYGMGVVAYGVFSWRAPTVAAPSGSAPRRNLLRTAVVLLVLFAGLAFAAYQVRSFRKAGSLTPPKQGGAAAFLPAEEALRAKVLPKFRGRVVWSSNRAGQHDLWMVTFPGGELTRLTEHPHTETYPRFSPDGRRIVFCRSQQPWVSQRNPVPWDTHVLEVGTRAATLVATNAFTPTWSPDGQGVVFVREGSQVLWQSLDTAATAGTAPHKVLASAGRGGFPGGLVFQTPDLRRDGTLAVTLRGKQRGTVLCWEGQVSQRVGGGCQVGWLPGSDALTYVDDGGHMKNAIYRFDPAGAKKSLVFDAPGAFSHEYFPRVSPDGRWLVYAASEGGHEHDTADYEVFLWQVGTPMETTVRLTSHTGNDCWPDVFVDE